MPIVNKPAAATLPDPVTDPIHVVAAGPQITAKFVGASQTGFTVNTGNASSSVTVSADGTGKAQLDLIEDSNDGEVFFSTNNGSLVMPRTGFTGSILAVGIGGVAKLEASSVGLGFFAATPAAQPTAVADAAGGAIIDVQARAALNALLARVRTLGLIAT